MCSSVVREVLESGREFRDKAGRGVWETNQVKIRAKREAVQQTSVLTSPRGAQLVAGHTELLECKH